MLRSMQSYVRASPPTRVQIIPRKWLQAIERKLNDEFSVN